MLSVGASLAGNHHLREDKWIERIAVEISSDESGWHFGTTDRLLETHSESIGERI